MAENKLKNRKFHIGDRVIHPDFGLGTVVAGQSEKISVDFDGRNSTLVAHKQTMLRHATLEDEKPRAPSNWLQTFQFEDEDARHYPGSHWDAFYDDASQVFERMSEIIPEAQPMTGYAEFYTPPRACPSHWTQGFYMAWPQVRLGLLVAITQHDGFPNEALACFPFVGTGSEQTITIECVHVWESGLEAQIKGSLGDTSIVFFDPLYAVNRAWYEAGRSYQFILAGIAYHCKRAKDQIHEIPEGNLLDFIRQQAIEDGCDPDSDKLRQIHTQGMAVLLPITEWDRDDYHFRGTVRSVKEIEMLEQPAWRLCITVLRMLDSNEDINIDVIVTHNVWGETKPPCENDDIEGSLWLQGYLWSHNES